MIERFYRSEAAEKQMGFAHAVQAGQMLFVSGVVSWDENFTPLHPGNMAGQMRGVYASLSAFLAGLDASTKDIVKETVYVTSLEDAVAVLDVRRSFFETDALPAATWVEVAKLIHPDLVIEVDIIAMIGVGEASCAHG